MKRIIAISAILLTLLVTGCATKLEQFKDNSTLNPDDRKGVVVIAYESDTAIHSLIFSGPAKVAIEHTLYDQKHNYVVTTMPAGTYDIIRAKIYNRYNYIELGSDDGGNWKVNIEPNKINYIGHFNLDRIGAGFKVQTKNESTLALSFLKENYPSLMNRYPLVYAKDGTRDDFFSYIKTLEGEE
ncbi:MAG: hypothetical protein OQJ95_10720 [Kangiella sp.]|nr:hypothetical protein [Kangiella sp.]